MRLLPHSLFGRMMALALATTLAALVVAGIAIGGILERFVTRGLDQRLDAQIRVLVRAVDDAGRFDPGRAFDLPDFADRRGGWRWLVVGPDGRRWSNEEGARLRLPDGTPPAPRGRGKKPDDEPSPGEALGPDGGALHYRQLLLDRRNGPVAIYAAAPRSLVERPLWEALTPLLLSLAALGGALALAAYVQLRLGLRPVAALREAVAAVRSGERRDVPVDQPDEIRPLALELNALIRENETGLANARRHVANLAHGLKTPLAALRLRLAEPGADPSGYVTGEVDDIDRRIRHHLARARAAQPGSAVGHRTALAPAVCDLLAIMGKVHADRSIASRVEGTDELLLAVEPQDLDELLGNVLDNAFRHARFAVSVTARREGAMARVCVEDDGPGLLGSEREKALLPGWRLDEAGGGHGFGLPISREIAELYGGTLTLGASPDGGLAVEFRLPAVSSKAQAGIPVERP